jgi:hypothetical protein
MDKIIYKIADKVIYLGKKCQIVATKEVPLKRKYNPYKSELYAKKDFYLYEYIENKDMLIDGFDVYEYEIEKKGW